MYVCMYEWVCESVAVYFDMSFVVVSLCDFSFLIYNIPAVIPATTPIIVKIYWI